MQPGETITPGAAPTPAPEPEKQQPVPSPAGWQFTGSEDQSVEIDAQPNIQPVSWTASEYIAHNKGLSWFVLLGIVLFAAAALLYVLTKEIVTSVMVSVAGITFGVFAARSPRVLEYTIDSRGVSIGQKLYPYTELKSFDVTEEGPLPAILLEPLKRFLPPITVFYDQNEEQAILEVLGSYLPHQEKKPDAVDKLMRHIRF
jgi:hypothetical protein